MKDFDIKLTILITLLCIPFDILPQLNETPMRIIFSLPLMLFLPGYSFIAVLFPKKHDLGEIDRVALSFGLSIAIVSLLGLTLNYTPFGVRLTPVLTLLSLFTISLSIIAWVRRMKFPDEERLSIPFERLLKINLGKSVLDKGLSIILISSIIVSSVTLFYAVVTPRTGERFTEFYLLGPNKIASDYPIDLKVGEKGKVIIGIVNHENKNITYRLEVNFNGSIIHEEHIFLIKNEKWENSLIFIATDKGENQKLEFLIYKNQQIEAYRTLHLWVNVT